jgi:hypothetical protein
MQQQDHPTSGTENRNGARLHVHNAAAFLRMGSFQSLPCSIVNISTGGCRLEVLFNIVDEQSASNWAYSFLRAGNELTLEIARLPHLPILQVRAAVCYVHSAAERVFLGLRFVNLGSTEKTMLSHAIDSRIATEEPVLTADSVRLTNSLCSGKRLTRILTMMGKLSEHESDRVERATLTSRKPLTHYLLRRGLVSSFDLTEAVALQSGFPSINLEGFEIQPSIFPASTLRHHQLIPFDHVENVICVATPRPLDVSTIRDLEQRYSIKLLVFIAPVEQVQDALDQIDPQEPSQRRSSERYTLSGAGLFRFSLFDLTTFPVRILNIGKGGFMFQTEDDISRCGVAVNFLLALTPHKVQGLGSVRFCRYQQISEDRWAWVGGVEILEMEPEDRATLDKVCDALATGTVAAEPSAATEQQACETLAEV